MNEADFCLSRAGQRIALEPKALRVLTLLVSRAGRLVDKQELLELAIRRLPDSQRVPLVLFHFQEMSYEEIAIRLGVSLAKVKSDIHRGREALKKLLNK